MHTLKRFMSKDTLLTFSFVIGLVLASNITLPFYPVPFTLQTAILLVAVFYNVNLAFRSTLVYVILGCIGVPVFANWENAYMLIAHPYAGYVIGYLLATGLLCYLNPKNILVKIGLFYTLVFACGVVYLATAIGYQAAIKGGLVVFIIPEIIKSTFAYFTYRYIK